MKLNPQCLTRRIRQLVITATTIVLFACSPALNWRDVQLDRLAVLLPCKPDRAQRTVPLAGANLAMDMAGCEADGALFAASHVRAANGLQALEALDAWRAASFANMRADRPLELPSKGPLSGVTLQQFTANGQRATGEPLQARMAWWVSGSDVFHVAVYAQTLREDHTDVLFNQAKIQ